MLATLLDALVPSCCIACDGPTVDALCARCSESVERAPAQFVSAFAYGGPIADAIRAAKFRRDAAVADALARLWVERAELPAIDVVTFVPAPFRRRLKRGFDLPAVLARALAKHARVPFVDALRCTRADAPLSFGADKAARAVIVSGRFRARRSLAGLRVLLVDDVRTTGATLAEAARALDAREVVQASLAVVL
ncbi:MAG TPA: phosphoribosyltransferase family protein [Myxococcota bacterium]